LDTHRNLLDLPQKQAQQKYATLPDDQQRALVDTFGNEPDKPKKGFFESAARYSGIYWTFKALNKVAQVTDRTFRFGQIVLEETLGDKPRGLTKTSEAWKEAGETGELVFNPSRIKKAEAKYGADRIAVAIKADSGMPLDEIQATGTPTQQKIAAEAAQNRDPLFQDAIDSVKAAKYSPGRLLANALLPESLEGSGPLYKGVSGFTDATYRIYTDPTLILGKAKKIYDVANYALFKIVGSPQNVDRVFRNPSVVKFFDTYGAKYGLMGMGGYFTDTPSIASEYASTGQGKTPTVYKTYLNIKNPIDMDAVVGATNVKKWEEAFPDVEFANGDTPKGKSLEEAGAVVESYISLNLANPSALFSAPIASPIIENVITHETYISRMVLA
jgi:hypothetical protein